MSKKSILSRLFNKANKEKRIIPDTDETIYATMKPSGIKLTNINIQDLIDYQNNNSPKSIFAEQYTYGFTENRNLPDHEYGRDIPYKKYPDTIIPEIAVSCTHKIDPNNLYNTTFADVLANTPFVINTRVIDKKYCLQDCSVIWDIRNIDVIMRKYGTISADQNNISLRDIICKELPEVKTILREYPRYQGLVVTLYNDNNPTDLEYDYARIAVLNHKGRIENQIRNINSEYYLYQHDIDETSQADRAWRKVADLAHHLVYSTYGREFDKLSSETARALCVNLLCPSTWDPDIKIKNPVAEFDEDIKENPNYIDDLSDQELSSFFMDCNNINALFNEHEYETAGNVFLRLMKSIEMNDYSACKLSQLISNGAHRHHYRLDRYYRPKNIMINSAPTKNIIFKKPNTDCFVYRSPKEIYEIINEKVINQEDAKKAAAMLVHSHIKGQGRNLVMAGPTGCGKTEIWRTLSTVYPCIRIITGPQLVPEGIKGSGHLADIFISADDEIRDRLIIVVDEADKLFERENQNNLSCTTPLQNELLRIMDHTENNIVTYKETDHMFTKTIDIDCSGISIVLCGSFERMLKNKTFDQKHIGFTENVNKNVDEPTTDKTYTEQDLIDYANIRVEIAGRINQIVTLNAMTAHNFKTILDHPTASPIAHIEKELGVKIKVNETAKLQLAEEAIRTKLGCRIMKSKILQCVDDQIFENPDAELYDISDDIIALLKDSNKTE